MTAILVDDEAAALAELQSLLDEFCPTVNVMDTANSAAEALRKIAAIEPDLLFLDIHMPKETGFDLIKQLPKGNRPEVIFVTSLEAYGLEAIRSSAIGYVMKPIELKHLLRAVQLAEERVSQKNSAKRLDVLLGHLAQPTGGSLPIGIPTEQGIDFFPADEIVNCIAEDRYTRIRLTRERDILSSYSIGEFVRMLEPFGFLNVHRAHLVNRMHIRKFDRSGFLIMANKDEVPVSRRRRPHILKILQENRV
ncbi:LytTR family DNA-binding domain-containing protein [Lewinella sp. W8]|uniref:LytR/AlgR family response regulator transcription factor n=1 Tax=Lewinella sp. W8 TaxID=2528208 RepID=UPI0010679B97|nr:LytTR family DNA-binding domain-containing protein [Lewinella sp. W8]MTB51790.1 response regulator [Lewinella sp. W8]